jgi:ABC-type Fe3+/spermidine/putrescine transport system ATPase subunit
MSAADGSAIDIRGLVRRYGRTDAVNGLSLTVLPGRCYGFFGRNGAGKPTTIKCLLNLLRPSAGRIRVFGLDPTRDEVAVKSRLAYVPDVVAFYPWMTIRQTLDYFASFRARWNSDIEEALLTQFRLDVGQTLLSVALPRPPWPEASVRPRKASRMVYGSFTAVRVGERCPRGCNRATDKSVCPTLKRYAAHCVVRASLRRFHHRSFGFAQD